MHTRNAIAALLGILALCLSLPLAATTQQAAAMVPLAPRALLLDICAAGERLVAAGEHGIIVYSDDNGNNWQQAQVPTNQMLTGIFFANARQGWAVGHDGLILFSEDAGQSWRIQRDGLAVQQQTNLELREAAYRSVRALEAELAGATDENRTTLSVALEDANLDLEDADIALTEPVYTSPFMDVWFQDKQRGWAVGAFGNFVGTRDGGGHWLNQADALDNPDEYHLNAVTGDGNGRVFIAGEGGVMFRSFDNGQQWEALDPFYRGSWFGTVYLAGNDTLYVFGLQGNFFRSDDFGSSWRMVPNESSNILAGGSATPGGELLVVGAVGTVLTSTDGGESFQRTMMEDRLSLSAGLVRDGMLVLVGQGGVKLQRVTGHE